MKSYKKVLALICAGLSLISLSSCSKVAKSSASPPDLVSNSDKVIMEDSDGGSSADGKNSSNVNDTPSYETAYSPKSEAKINNPPADSKFAVLRINIKDGASVSKSKYTAAEFTLENTDGSKKTYKGKIRGRGNSTWTQDPKKNYTVKLNDKAPLLGMASGKNWALVSNYEDRTMLRNLIGNYVSENAGLAAKSRGQFAEVYLGWDYIGLYYVAENPKVEENRIPVNKYTGILLEFDVHTTRERFEDGSYSNEFLDVSKWEEYGWKRVGGAYYRPDNDETFIMTDIGDRPAVIKNPDEITPVLADKIIGVVGNATNALKSGDWRKIDELIDVYSFVRWYLVQEFTDNVDTAMYSSVYMYIDDKTGKLTMGAPWDFDRSAGNTDYWNIEHAPDALYSNKAAWFSYLFEQPEARAILKKEWDDLQPSLIGLTDYIRNWQTALTPAANRNFYRWNELSAVLPDIANVGATTYDGYVEYLVNYLETRRGKMDVFYKSLA